MTFIISITLHGQSGIVWGPAMDIAPNSFDNMHPRITLDGSGDPMVIWGDVATDAARFSHWTGSSFSTPISLNPSSIPIYVYSWAGADIASKGDTVYAVFKHQDADSNYIYLVRSFDAGNTFSTPNRVDLIADSLSDFPTVGVDQNGQPLVAFMRFDPGYLNVRWVVSRSTDHGTSFLPDVLASNASGPEVCDCCPGAIVSSGNNVAMLYRANVSNLRDNWVALSSDDGTSFPNGMNIDQHNWMLASCPSSGPDGVIVDDTLYSIFMNGSGGTRIYTNRNHVGTFTSAACTPITGPITGLSQQNYGRIANYGTAVAEVWKQVISGTVHLSLLFTENIHAGFPPAFDTITSGAGSAITNADVAVSADAVHVVWQSDATGTIKYRKGYFGPAGISHSSDQENALVLYPNPANGQILLKYPFRKRSELTVFGITGNILLKKTIDTSEDLFLNTEELLNGSYFILINDGEKMYSGRFMVLR